MFPVPFCQQDGIIDRKRENAVRSHQVGIAWEGRRKMAEFEENGSGSICSLKQSITGSPFCFFGGIKRRDRARK